MKHALENYSVKLLEKGIKPSYQRLKILEYLMMKRNHSHVDEIYCELVKEIPTMSKTTVYNTMNIFLDKGMAKLVNIDDSQARYDIDVSEHGHFMCQTCGVIWDFPVNFNNIEVKGLERFKIDEKSVYFKGICHNCL